MKKPPPANSARGGLLPRFHSRFSLRPLRGQRGLPSLTNALPAVQTLPPLSADDGRSLLCDACGTLFGQRDMRSQLRHRVPSRAAFYLLLYYYFLRPVSRKMYRPSLRQAQIRSLSSNGSPHSEQNFGGFFGIAAVACKAQSRIAGRVGIFVRPLRLFLVAATADKAPQQHSRQNRRKPKPCGNARPPE